MYKSVLLLTVPLVSTNCESEPTKELNWLSEDWKAH